MSQTDAPRHWSPGAAPVAVVMISLNEAHNMDAVLSNLSGWAQEVFVVDSYSRDETVEIALRHGAHVVQRPFRSFGDQWNFALRELPVTAPWTMKLDPDERVTDALKAEIISEVREPSADAYTINVRLAFMRRLLPVRYRLLRLWRTGIARMSDVSVNEHILVDGSTAQLREDIEHHDSPDLDHWLEKQNRYTTREAVSAHAKDPMADTPRVFGSRLQRRMWLKKNFSRVPFRFSLFFLYHWVVLGAWRCGWVGYAWARLRADVMRLVEYKRREIEVTGRTPTQRQYGAGIPDARVPQYD
jgi:glycosyltransferase involved in cell wall biosynthesis